MTAPQRFRVVLAGLCLLVSGASFAQTELSRASLEAWGDSVFRPALEARQYSGAVITVVHSGEILFARGYGFADYAAETPVSVEDTRFRIGSITKTFTATALAQLIDRRRIGSLDDPVNQYLKRDEIPEGFGKEVTLRHLVTHTGGFADRSFGMAADREIQVPLSSEEVQRQQPPIVREPGTLSVYSNYGTALIGILIEDITGLTMSAYLEQNVFAPLGMNDTELSYAVRKPPELGQPYVFWPSGESEAVPYWGVHPMFAPVGAIITTAPDMVRYMSAHLDAGRHTRSPLMSAASFEAMHRRITGVHPDIQGNPPAVSGFAVVFMTFDWNGERVVMHGGDWPGFHSLMVLLPDRDLGLFVSIMSEPPFSASLTEQILGSERLTPRDGVEVLGPITNVGVLFSFFTHFLGEYTPEREMPVETTLEDFVGVYRHEYRAHTTMESALDLLNGPFATTRVTRDGEGGLAVNGRGGFRPVAPGVFFNADAAPGLDGTFIDSPIWAFGRDEDERVDVVSPLVSVDPSVRVGRFWNPEFVGAAWGIMTLVMLTGPIAFFWPASSVGERRSRYVPILYPLLLVAIPLILLEGYGEGDSFIAHYLTGKPGRFVAVLVCTHVLALGSMMMLFAARASWRHAYWGPSLRGRLRRIHFSVLTATALGLLPIFWYSHLIGWRLP